MRRISNNHQTLKASTWETGGSPVRCAIGSLGVSLAFSGALGAGGVTLRLMQRSMCNMLVLLSAVLAQLTLEHAAPAEDAASHPSE